MLRVPQRRADGSQWPMHPVAALLVDYLEVRAVWSIGHEPAAGSAPSTDLTFLVFADERTLEQLRKSPAAGVKVLVVTDGDLFQNVARPSPVSGSLARSAWRQTSTSEAFYDEAQWASGGNVIRVRRKAMLVWHR